MKYLLPVLVFSSSLFAQALSQVDPAQIESWERQVLSEIDKYKKDKPGQEFMIYLTLGREASAHGLTDKAQKYYQKAIDHKLFADKSEAYVEMIHLSLNRKTELAVALKKAKEWFKKNPRYQKKEINEWLKLLEGSVNSKTEIPEKSYYKKWASDSKIQELMSDKKYEEAYRLSGRFYFQETNINEKIRYDLLSVRVLGKKSPPLKCKTLLDRYPTSITWTMRMCRFLDDWKQDKKSTQSVELIRKQVKTESPERESWVDALENLP